MDVCCSYFGDSLVVMQSDDRNTQKLYAMLVQQKYQVFNLITEEKLSIHPAFYVTLSTLVRTETAIFVLLIILPVQ